MEILHCIQLEHYCIYILHSIRVLLYIKYIASFLSRIRGKINQIFTLLVNQHLTEA